jgi:predicted ATPase/class 3 adenylate cyclase/Tfp pilus assembly protein PilF
MPAVSHPNEYRYLPTGTVTFLFTDIEGSTKLWERERAVMQRAVAEHDAIIRDAVEAHNGYLVKTTGDGAHAAFAVATDALAASIAAQRRLNHHDWGSAVIRSRMGLHTGVAEQRDGDYYGPALNRAARLMSAGHGGQILLSMATMELVRDHLSADTALRDLGERRLKDLIRPERVYQVVVPDLPSEFPALKTLDVRRNNLPAQTTSLIGREREIRAVRSMLAEAQVRLLTLTGVGGTGKTRLALQVAADVVDEFEHGVYFVPVAALRDPSQVMPAIAHALGIEDAQGKPSKENVHDYLREKQVLLVLDNLEQLIDAGPLVAELLATARRCKVLATSREMLHLSGEHVYPVPTLSVPDPKRMPALSALTQYEAVLLFIDRARMLKPDFAVTNATAPAIAEICYQLDGLPLAIELAAGRTQLLQPHQMLKQLSNRLRFVRSSGRDRPARQQTLRGTIDWSHDLLTAGEQTLFRRLSVFHGGCTLDAAQSVCNANDDLSVLETMESLVAKSLVKPVDVNGEARIAMLETVRDYAAERLIATEEHLSVTQRHEAYFLNFAEEAKPQLFGANQRLWLRRLENEHENLRSALEFTFAAANSEHSLRFCGALGRFWASRDHVAQGREWCSRALAISGNNDRSPARAASLLTAGRLAYQQGDYPTAEALDRESLAIYRELDDQSGVASSLNGLGNDAFAQEHYASAQAAFEESLAIYRQLGDEVQVAGALNNLGRLAINRGDLDAADGLLERSLATARRLGDLNGVAGSCGNLGVIALQRGDVPSARRRFEECLKIALELNNQIGIARSLVSLGHVAVSLRDYAQARMRTLESLAIHRELGNRPGIADALLLLANVAYEEADYTVSMTMLEESLQIWRDLGVEWGIGHALSGLASLIAVKGDVQRAARIWGQVERLCNGTPTMGPGHEQRISDARIAMDDDSGFARAWQEGRALSRNDAVKLASSNPG